MNWDSYEYRLNLRGKTKRGREIANLKLNIAKAGIYSPSCKVIYIGTVKGLLFIDSTETAGVKKYTDVYHILKSAGTLIHWAGADWLVDSYDMDNEVYADGNLLLCNYELHFLDAGGKPKSKMCYVENYTKYNTGVKITGSNNKMELGSTHFFIKLPLDTDTKILDRVYPDGKEQRILLDKESLRPKAYQITLADRVSYPGLLALAVEECLASEDDNVDLMIADYYNRVDTSSPSAPTTDYCEILYSGEPVLKIGQGYKTFSAVFKDTEGVALPDIVPVWSLESDDTKIEKVFTQEDSGKFLLKVTDRELLGFKFHLVLADETSAITSSIEIEVMSVG